MLKALSGLLSIGLAACNSTHPSGSEALKDRMGELVSALVQLMHQTTRIDLLCSHQIGG